MITNSARELIRGAVCLVTGGGGSIGSELSAQLAGLGAEKIIIADIYENGAYDVKCRYGGRICAEIASVRDYGRMERIFSTYRPALVFHTAAHKHVPFMEDNPEEAVKNNIRGTEITAELAEKYGADAFVLISTDKAVEPVSVMGASKRICEMLVYEKSRDAVNTKFFSVRFGNVVNSNGSVIPLFKKQLESGVVTVTDPKVTRYFMTIPDAVNVIINAAALADGGEVFVPEMGEAVSILRLAEQIIREAGREPYEDVRIEFTGLRKGDKLEEKLFWDFEKPEKTSADKLVRVSGSSIDHLSQAIGVLYKMAENNDRDGIRKKIFEITEKNWRT